MFKGKKIVLHPMTPDQIVRDELARASREQQPSANQVVAKEIKLKGPVLLATQSDLHEWDARKSPYYALMCTQVLYSINDAPSSVPRAVANLLQEYFDIFPKDVLAGLPPLRGIEHQIDLIPGASLPNRAPYRTNPDETKEIQRQV